MNNWNKFLRLARHERWLFGQALLLLPLTVVALRLIGFGRWQSVIARFTPRRQSVVEDASILMDRARQAAHMVRAVARRLPFDSTCLPRSLTVWWLLRRQGIDSDLRIGVRKENGVLKAHAWVEYRGVIVHGGNDVHRRFAAFEPAIAPREVMYL